MVLPKKIEQLIDADVFTQDDLIDDTMLYKMEMFVPAIAEAHDLVIAQLKGDKGRLAIELWSLENEELAQERARIMLGIDKKAYPNADLREARTTNDERIVEIMAKIRRKKEEINEIDTEINTWIAKVWRFKNLQNNLDNISKLRISERKY